MTSSAPSSAAQAPEPLAEPTDDRGRDFDLLLPLRSAGALENPYPMYALLRTVRPVLEMPIPDYTGPGA